MSDRVSRRQFVGAVSAASVGLSSSASFGAGVMSGRPNLEDFLPALNEQFRLRAEDGNATVATLIEAVAPESTDPNRPAGLGSCFSLLFRVDGAADELGQGSYRVSHTVVGDHDLFLVPVGMGENGGVLLEAVFN